VAANAAAAFLLQLPRANERSWRFNIPILLSTVIEQIGLPRAVARNHNR
jgi:hypothetical protein